MTRRPAVAFVSREYPPFFGGGIGTYAARMVPALVDAGTDVHVITAAHDRSEPRFSVRDGAAIHRLPVAPSGGDWTPAMLRFGVQASRLVLRLARTAGVRAAEFPECEAAGLPLSLAAIAGRAPVGVIAHLHTPSEVLDALGSLNRGPGAQGRRAATVADRWAVTLADMVCSPSRFLAEWAHREYRLPEMPEVIPYALERRAPSAPPLPAGRRVLYVGRIEARKGVDVLVRAWAEIVRDRPDAQLRLVGADTTGPGGRSSMRAMLERMLPTSARRTVRFMGPVDPAQLREQYAWSSVCVVPSLWENFPNVCIDAMLHARPVVVSDRGGMREMIGATRAGAVFATGDAGQCAAALSSMLDASDAERAARGREARARILEMCAPSDIAERRVALYAEAAKRAASRSRAPAASRVAAWRAMDQDASAPPDWLDSALRRALGTRPLEGVGS